MGSLFDKLFQVELSNFSLFPITKSTSLISAYFLGLICAAHPVTIIFLSGEYFLDFLISYNTFFSACSVTAQELIIV